MEIGNFVGAQTVLPKEGMAAEIKIALGHQPGRVVRNDAIKERVDRSRRCVME